MIENAKQYLAKKFEIANDCLKNTVEYGNLRKEPSTEVLSDEEYFEWIKKEEDIRCKIWDPLTEFQKQFPQEPHFYIKKNSSYARVFFVPSIENVNHIISNEKIPRKFVKNQVNRDPWSIVISQDFVMRYSILHLMWIVGIMRTRDSEDKTEYENPFKNFQFPDFVPKCKHCGRHFNKKYPNQKYCDMCRLSLKKIGFNPLTDLNKHRYCLNCGKHLPNNKHKKAKFCIGACRTAYFRKKQKEKMEIQ
jgi:hypothetical protein